MRNRNKHKYAVIGLLAAGAVVGLAAYVQTTPANQVPAQERRDRGGPTVDTHRPAARQEQVVVFTPEMDGVEFGLRSKPAAPPAGVDARVFVVNEYLKHTAMAEDGVRLLSVDVHDGVANLYFNSAFNRTFGSSDEQIILQGVGRSLGQFSEIQSMRFFADGEPVETIGNVELSEPIPVMRG
jgi:hypothetical protein